jgi:hypothetical protein
LRCGDDRDGEHWDHDEGHDGGGQPGTAGRSQERDDLQDQIGRHSEPQRADPDAGDFTSILLEMVLTPA